MHKNKKISENDDNIFHGNYIKEMKSQSVGGLFKTFHLTHLITSVGFVHFFLVLMDI